MPCIRKCPEEENPYSKALHPSREAEEASEEAKFVLQASMGNMTDFERNQQGVVLQNMILLHRDTQPDARIDNHPRFSSCNIFFYLLAYPTLRTRRERSRLV